MSMLQRNRASSLGFLLSSKSTNGFGARRSSASFTSRLIALPSCPALSSVAPSGQELCKRARVTSAPFIRRKGDFGGCRQAHEGHNSHICSGELLPPQAATFNKSLSEASFFAPTRETSAIQGSPPDLSGVPHLEATNTMPKAPQLSFRSPISQPKMLPLQSSVYSPMTKSPVTPQILSFSAMPSSLYNFRPLPSAQDATITAVLEPHRRSPPPESRSIMRLVSSTEDEHVLSVHLPGFAPEMVTVSTRKEDKLAVVADLWHAESNCHHEWLVVFSSRDANVLQTRAQFSADGTLTIHVPRRKGSYTWTRSRLR